MQDKPEELEKNWLDAELEIKRLMNKLTAANSLIEQARGALLRCVPDCNCPANNERRHLEDCDILYRSKTLSKLEAWTGGPEFPRVSVILEDTIPSNSQ